MIAKLSAVVIALIIVGAFIASVGGDNNGNNKLAQLASQSATLSACLARPLRASCADAGD